MDVNASRPAYGKPEQNDDVFVRQTILQNALHCSLVEASGCE